MPARRRLIALAVIAATVAAAVVAGCGGGSSEDAKALLKKGFSESIPSANVTVDISVKVDGVPQLSQPIRVKFGGPFKSNGRGRLPSLDWDISFSGAGQNLSAGLISTGDQGYVNYQGTNYKVDDATMAKLNQAAASRNPSGANTLKGFGIDPLNWIKDASEEGDADVAGVTTKHVSAGVDIGKLFSDLNKVVAKAGGSVGTVRPQQLSPQIIDSIKKVVHDPKLDVYVGKQDDKIRRVSLGLRFEVPQAVQASARGVTGGEVTASVEFASVGEPQTVQAPTSSKPISELAGQLGGLGGALGGPGGGTGGTSGGGTGGTGGSSPSSDKYQKYAQCLRKAKPSDIAAIQRCSALLK